MHIRPFILNLILMAACLITRLGKSDQLSISDAFTLDTSFQHMGQSAIFMLQTRPWDGLSDSSNSGIFTLDARNSISPGLTILGASTVTGGTQSSYSIQNAGVDVGLLSTLGFNHAPVTYAGIGGHTLFTYPVSSPQTVQLIATYRGPGGQVQSSMYPVTILPNAALRARATVEATPQGATFYSVVLEGAASGGTAPYTFLWDTDKDGQHDDRDGATSSYLLNSQGGTYPIKLEVTDALGAKAYAVTHFTVDKTEVPNQPTKVAPASDGGQGAFLTLAGNPFQFDLSRVDNGLIVITHGLRSSGREAWIRDLAARISASFQPPETRPNILIYDWEYGANPNSLTITNFEAALLSGGAEVAKKLDWMVAGRALSTISAADTLTDVLGIKPMGLAHGDILGYWILQEAQANPPRVNLSKKIHLIGHSAGGFVVGGAAMVLKQSGHVVDRVTMLDTPYPEAAHVRELPNPTVVERYVSSIFGALQSPWGSAPTSDYHWIEATYFDFIWDFGLALTGFGHSKAHEWYGRTVYPDEGYDYLGFYFSPFKSGPMAPRSPPPPAFAFMQRASATSESVETPPTSSFFVSASNFEAFGAASETSGVWTITENSDAGIFAQIELPPDAIQLRFKYQWSGTGDGDFLGVRFGTRPEMFVGNDLPISRSAFRTAEIDISMLSERDEKLIFTLVSRGQTGAILQLKDIEIVQDADADRDGLTTAQEQTAGTNPLLYDSDGDGLSDPDEMQTYFTNPNLTDSDGDGADDKAELTAGTSPTNGQSYLRVTDAIKNTGSTFLLRWPSQAGRFYNVQRSTDVTFATYEVISHGQTATPPLNTHVDNAAGAAQRMFYRIEVYQP